MIYHCGKGGLQKWGFELGIIGIVKDFMFDCHPEQLKEIDITKG